VRGSRKSRRPCLILLIETLLLSFTPSNVFVVSPVDEGVDFPIGIVTKEDPSFASSSGVGMSADNSRTRAERRN